MIDPNKIGTCLQCPTLASSTSISSNGSLTCDCPQNSFLDIDYSKPVTVTTCKQCSNGTSTISSGAMSIFDCTCDIGYIWNGSYCTTVIIYPSKYTHNIGLFFYNL